MERVMGIEPTRSAWKADVLPLNYTRGLNRSRTQESHTRMLLTPRTSPFAADESANFGARHATHTQDGGERRIRTAEGRANGFTVRPV